MSYDHSKPLLTSHHSTLNMTAISVQLLCTPELTPDLEQMRNLELNTCLSFLLINNTEQYRVTPNDFLPFNLQRLINFPRQPAFSGWLKDCCSDLLLPWVVTRNNKCQIFVRIVFLLETLWRGCDLQTTSVQCQCDLLRREKKYDHSGEAVSC